MEASTSVIRTQMKMVMGGAMERGVSQVYYCLVVLCSAVLLLYPVWVMACLITLFMASHLSPLFLLLLLHLFTSFFICFPLFNFSGI